MTDASSLVPWLTALLGCAASYVLGRRSVRELRFSTVLLAGAKAFALSIASFFAGAMLHGLCIDVLHRCTSHGDGNIRYAMGGVLAFPVFWIVIVWFGRLSELEPVRSIADQCDAACSAALIQHLEGRPGGTPCPVCKQALATQQNEAMGQQTSVWIRCSCGNCDKRYTLRPSKG